MGGFADREKKRRQSVVEKMFEAEPEMAANQEPKPEKKEKAPTPVPAAIAEPIPPTVEEKTAESQPPKSGVVVAKKRETRSRKANFLFKPSVYNRANEKCRQLDISLNECVNQLLENWVNGE